MRKKGAARRGRLVSFNEAMCAGEVTENIFSAAFIEKRCKAHKAAVPEYNEKIIGLLDALTDVGISKIVLWFDFDMFCQINLLTVLAYLDQIFFSGDIVLKLVNTNFEKEKEYQINIHGYYELYKSVMIQKSMPANIIIPELEKGVRLYLNYIKPNNEIIQYIKEHRDVQPADLTGVFPQYGLGDIQYNELIGRALVKGS